MWRGKPAGGARAGRATLRGRDEQGRAWRWAVATTLRGLGNAHLQSCLPGHDYAQDARLLDTAGKMFDMRAKAMNAKDGKMTAAQLSDLWKAMRGGQ